MTETSPSFSANSKNPAIKSDGFVDYYELLHEEPHATITRLRSTINDLYNEAQANRDHRNLNKRRGYQEMLDLLPQARELLLNESIRHKYDIYREEALSGIAKQSFDEWKNETLASDEDTAEETVLGVQEEQQRLRGQEVRAQVLKVTKEAKPKSRVVIEKENGAPQSTAPVNGSVASAIVFFAVLLIAIKLFHASLPVAILIGALIGIAIWLVARFANKSRTAV